MLMTRVIALLLGLAAAWVAAAQSWPQKTVRIIVPFPVGGAADIPARIVAERLAELWGQPVIIENRAGAGGALGAAEAARATADGYTLFFPSGSVVTAHQHMNPRLNYNPEKDFVPITNVTAGPQVLVVAANAPYRTVKELLDEAKANPDKLTFGHAGIGSQTHLAGENFVHAAGVRAVSVPYKGDPPALADLVAGSITFCLTNVSSTMGHLNAGRLRALGVTSTTEFPQLAGVPPIAKTLPGFENSGWFGFVAPAGTPNEIVQRVWRDTKAVLEDTRVKARFYALGMTPVGNSPQEMGRAMRAESARWARVVSERNLRIQ